MDVPLQRLSIGTHAISCDLYVGLPTNFQTTGVVCLQRSPIRAALCQLALFASTASVMGDSEPLTPIFDEIADATASPNHYDLWVICCTEGHSFMHGPARIGCVGPPPDPHYRNIVSSFWSQDTFCRLIYGSSIRDIARMGWESTQNP